MMDGKDLAKRVVAKSKRRTEEEEGKEERGEEGKRMARGDEKGNEKDYQFFICVFLIRISHQGGAGR